MYERAGTGIIPPGARDVGGGMFKHPATDGLGGRPGRPAQHRRRHVERPGTGTGPGAADRPVGGGMYEKAGTGNVPAGARDVGGGMFERPGTGTAENPTTSAPDKPTIDPLAGIASMDLGIFGKITLRIPSTPEQWAKASEAANNVEKAKTETRKAAEKPLQVITDLGFEGDSSLGKFEPFKVATSPFGAALADAAKQMEPIWKAAAAKRMKEAREAQKKHVANPSPSCLPIRWSRR